MWGWGGNAVVSVACSVFQEIVASLPEAFISYLEIFILSKNRLVMTQAQF